VSGRLAELDPFPDRSVELEALIGLESGAPQLSPHAVNAPMIHHWVEAMGDTNPIYVSEEAARAYGHERIVAPPAMLQAWIMRGLRDVTSTEAADGPGDEGVLGPYETMSALLEEEGLTGVRGTNCMQHYGRSLVLGDRLFARTFIESISEPTRTRLGPGRFITTRHEFTAAPDAGVPESPTPAEIAALAAAGEPVAIMRFGILRYLPADVAAASAVASASASVVNGDGDGDGDGDGASARAVAEHGVAHPRRPRPSVTQDNAFWFDGARNHVLLIQRCASCGTLRHPPAPACGVCQSLAWDTLEASGRGTLYSFVVVHHPRVEPFDYPLPIGLVELEEGTRLVANLDGIAPGELRIGLPLVATFVDYDPGLALPVFVPAGPGPGPDPGPDPGTGPA
jgi:uncharacterized OB-fold protein